MPGAGHAPRLVANVAFHPQADRLLLLMRAAKRVFVEGMAERPNRFLLRVHEASAYILICSSPAHWTLPITGPVRTSEAGVQRSLNSERDAFASAGRGRQSAGHLTGTIIPASPGELPLPSGMESGPSFCFSVPSGWRVSRSPHPGRYDTREEEGPFSPYCRDPLDGQDASGDRAP